MKREIKIILLSSIFWSFTAGMLGPIYAIFVERIGGNLLTTGSAYAAFAFTSGFLMLFTGKIADSVKRPEYLLVLGAFLSFLGTIGYLLVSNPTQLFIVQIILGFSEAIEIPVIDGLFSRHTKKRDSFFEWGAWESLWLIGTAIASIFGSLVAQNYGFKNLFVLMSIFSFGFFVGSIVLSWQITFQNKR